METNFSRLPNRRNALVFWVKSSLLKLHRAWRDTADGVRRHDERDAAAFPHRAAESRTPLWSEADGPERAMELGKVQNLRQALRSLDGIVIPAGALFSFWKQVGRATARRGYVPGRQLREGCLYPAVGGGLCQLSNALYDLALQAGCEIVERHPHTSVIPGSAAERGRDATVAWNYIDLRFRPATDLRIEARLTDRELIIRFLSAASAQAPQRPAAITLLPSAKNRPTIPIAEHSCASCGETECFRHGPVQNTLRKLSGPPGQIGRTAYLLDERWPEIETYLLDHAAPEDLLCIPIDGKRWRIPRHAWPTSRFADVHTATSQTLRRAYRSRRLGRYGAVRLAAQLDEAEALAGQLAAGLTPDVTHVVVTQTLLPALWRSDGLGGRRFDVLMTRLPLKVLHERLDAALARFPERRTLGEYRAPRETVEREWEALSAAAKLVTPHADVASLFGARAELIPWASVTPPRWNPGSAIAFPGPTAARKGAYEVREAARALGLEVVLLGSELEGEDFWADVATRRADRTDWLQGVCVVVQPSLAEDQPRAQLAAAAAGVPVITTAASGLLRSDTVSLVEYGDAEGLKQAIEQVRGRTYANVMP